MVADHQVSQTLKEDKSTVSTAEGSWGVKYVCVCVVQDFNK